MCVSVNTDSYIRTSSIDPVNASNRVLDVGLLSSAPTATEPDAPM